MFQLMFDPIGLLIEVANENYPDVEARIFWSNDLKDRQGQLVTGLTLREPGKPATVIISLDVPLHGAVETVAHELAHVIVKREVHDHCPEWFRVFQTLNQKYIERVQAAAGGHGEVQVIAVGDDLAREKGFHDLAEVNEMMAQLNVHTPGMLEAVKKWQETDGTKAGLLTLVNSAAVNVVQSLDEAARQNGFKDEQELFKMIAAVDMTLPGMPLMFKNWQNNDASKTGLQELLDLCKEETR